MKYLEKLLEGVEVEWRTLGEVVEINTGQRPLQILNSSGLFDYINAGTTRSGYCEYANCEGDTVTTPSRGQGGIGYIGYQPEPFWLGPLCYKLRSVNESLLVNKFLFYFLESQSQLIVNIKKEGGVPAVNKFDLNNLLIPIPPFEIQQEIVRILDIFSALAAQLAAQLANCKKQYAFYREELLTFGDDVEWKLLGEIAEYSKERIGFHELNEENYTGVDNLLQNKEGRKNSNYVPTEGNSTKYYKNDVLIGNIRPYLKKIWLSDRLGGTNGDVLVIHTTDPNLNPQYLYHVLADDKFFNYNMQHARGAKMPRGNKVEILNYPIPIPPLKEQERIINILDKFDALTTSISEGLPREIELREKQYEYYRDLLLTFPKDNLES